MRLPKNPFSLANIFGTRTETISLTKEQIADLLRTSPEALRKFEESYQAHIEDETDNLLDYSVVQAKRDQSRFLPDAERNGLLDSIVNRIVDELLAQTKRIVVRDGRLVPDPVSLPDTKATPVTPEELDAIPAEFRPQLTGWYYKRDIPEDSSAILLFNYDQWRKETDPEKKLRWYHMFRQGLDTLDLDPVTYEMLGTNPNAMGYWLPELVRNIKETDFLVPDTVIVKVPLSLLQLSRTSFQNDGLNPTTLRILDEYCRKAFGLDVHKSYFVKTGTYSSKFDFRNARVAGEKEVRELGEYLMFLSNQATLMASPLSTPCRYGASTTNQWVVRDYVPDRDKNPCIYKGMPLRTEYRVFVDFDRKEAMGIAPYWDPDTMKARLDGSGNIHDIHDYHTYCLHEPLLMERYERNKDFVLAQAERLAGSMDLPGQWSLDVMQDGDDFYVIDMALAAGSALNGCVRDQLRPVAENWLPEITE